MTKRIVTLLFALLVIIGIVWLTQNESFLLFLDDVQTNIRGAAPPAETADSGVRGLVLLGPQCPVLQVGVPCPDTPYGTTVHVSLKGASRPAVIVSANVEGKFEVSLKPGEYVLVPQGGSPFPACEEKDVTVVAGVFSEVQLLCDTGIR